MTLSLSIDSNIQKEKVKTTTIISEIKEGFRFVIDVKPILYSNVAMLFSIFGTTLFLTMLVIHLKSTARFDAIEIGFLLSIGGVAAIGGALTSNWLKKHFSYRSILFTAGALGGLSIIGFVMYDSFLWLAIMNAVGTVSAAIMTPCIVTIRQHLSPDNLLGRVQASSRFMTWLLMPVAALVAGLIAEQYSTTLTILIGGVVATASSFLYLHPSLKKA